MAIVINGSGTVSGLTEQASNVELTDSTKILVGTGDDLQIYHDGTDSYVKDNGTGNLLLQGTNLNLQSTAAENYIRCTADAQVELYHNNVKKLETTAAGVTAINIQSASNKFTNSNIACATTSTENGTGFCGISYSSSTLTNYGWTAGAERGTNGTASEFVFTAHNASASGAERMRITSGGVLLLGQTTGVSIGGGAVDLNATEFGRGYININRDDTGHNRLLQFGGNGVTIGSISGVSTGNGSIVVGNDSSGVMFRGDLTTSAFIPASPASGAQVDNTLDVGHSAIRFDDIYASNGTINTSDRNEKQDIEELSVAETAVATACKVLMRKFRWKSAVAKKGDDARIHFGIIAQDLQDAFTAEGLDAGDYAMFISTTWWETQTEVPAVEAVAEVTDEDGNVTTEAVEAKDAYTRTDTEDAPTEGYTERTRLGVRYPELLAFIISAI